MAIIAHRGFSGRQPEMTRAAYREAIAWSAATGVPLGVEADVHFSADDQLICLHDLTLDRTSDATGPAAARSVAELRRVDFSGGRVRRPTPEQRCLITLDELLGMVRSARERGVPVSAVIETKHPNPRGLDVEQRVAELLRSYGWHGRGSPVSLISFSLPAVDRLRLLLPELPRTLLLEHTLAPWTSGALPDAIDAVGPDLELLRREPRFVDRAAEHGHGVHTWTVNTTADAVFCRDLGVQSITTDHPDRVAAALDRTR